MKIESVQVIPMNKETIFDEPTPPPSDETFNVVETFEEWVEQYADVTNALRDKDQVVNIKLAANIGPYAARYMMAPVALYKGKSLMARSRGCTDVQEAIDEFRKLNEEGYDVFFYSCSTMSANTLDVDRKTIHIIRYAELKRD